MYYILCLLIGVLFGMFILSLLSANVDRETNDREQEQYLREYNKRHHKRKREKRNECN